MSRIIRYRERVRKQVFEMCFPHDPEQAHSYPPRGGWFGFKCNEKGEVDRDKLNPCARENFDYCCLMRPWGFLAESFSWYTEPGLMKCDCGQEIEIYSHHDVDCEKCGANYNSAGQRLAPRSQWGEETGEIASDYDFGVANPERAFDD